MMECCFELAAEGAGRTAPNPLVGAVVVARGEIVGQGSHRAAGKPHAELVALHRAGPRAAGGTLYLNLEPCSHTGRTPPCAEAVIEAGVARVVAAMRDPNPLVKGRGFARLRRAGIEVEVGLLADRARRLNEIFIHNVLTDSPFVSLKLAQTLDGKIAEGPGLRTQISGRDSLRLAHGLRARHGAVLVGVPTVIADDPLLTVRGIRGAQQPVRVVLDPSLRIPSLCKLVASSDRYPTFILFDPERAGRPQLTALGGGNLELVELGSNSEGLFDLHKVGKLLYQRGITSVLVEGGRRVATACLREHLVQRLHLFISPRLLGEDGPLHGIGDIGAGRSGLALRDVEQRLSGEDFYLTARLD